MYILLIFSGSSCISSVLCQELVTERQGYLSRIFPVLRLAFILIFFISFISSYYDRPAIQSLQVLQFR